MSLPTLCDPTTVRAMLAQEMELVTLGESFVALDHPRSDAGLLANVREHLAAIAHCNELACCHESDHPADQILFDSAVQLKAWHLQAIDEYLTL